MKKSILFLSLAAALMSTAASAATNLVVNGGFELTTLTGKGTFLNHVFGWTGGTGLTYVDFPTASGGNTATSSSGGYAVYGPFPNSPDGGNFVQADGDSAHAGPFSQSISGLTVGQNYTVTFDQAAGQQFGFKGNTTERWAVTFGGVTQLSDKFSLSTPEVGPWQAQSMTFTAKSATQVLSFLAVGTPRGIPPTSFLDGVSLLAAVPEPATWGMMIIGLGAMGAAARVRRRQALAAA